MSEDNDVPASRPALRGVRALAVGTMVMPPGRHGVFCVTDADTVEPPRLARGYKYTLEFTPCGTERRARATSAGRLTLAMHAATAAAHPSPRHAAPAPAGMQA